MRINCLQIKKTGRTQFFIWLGKFSSEGEERHGDELEMLFAKGDADNGDIEESPKDEMIDGDFPAKKHTPNGVENEVEPF